MLIVIVIIASMDGIHSVRMVNLLYILLSIHDNTKYINLDGNGNSIQPEKDVLSIVIDAMAVSSSNIAQKLPVLMYNVTIKQTQLLVNMVHMNYK